MKKLLLLVNPKSGTNDNLKNAQKITQKICHAWAVTQVNSECKGFLGDFLTHYDFTANPHDCIGIVGGDGTMHEVINGILANKTYNDTPFLLFPCGTGNALNHDIGCLNIETACENLLRGRTQKIDLLKLNTAQQQQHFAFNIVGWGLVSDINQRSERMRWLGGLRYTLTSLIDICLNPRFKATVTVDNQVFEGDFCFVLVSNTIHTGKAMKMSPLALLHDGLLDVTVVKHLPFWQLLQLFPLIFSGKHIESNLLTHITAKKISIEAAPTPLNIDGEVIFNSPINIEVMPQKLSIIV
jgi:diacylglycerol kinase (ATP)